MRSIASIAALTLALAACSQENAPSEAISKAAKKVAEKVEGAEPPKLAEGPYAPRDECVTVKGSGEFRAALSKAVAGRDAELAPAVLDADFLGALLQAASPPSTASVAANITQLTGRSAKAVLTNFYITAVTQSTSSASLDSGIIRLDNTQDPSLSTETHYLYNLNENLIMYSSASVAPDVIAPDSICYYSESTGRGFSNASDDLALYFDAATGKSTGQMVSVIAVQTAPQLYNTPGVVASFAGLLRNMGYAGAMPSA